MSDTVFIAELHVRLARAIADWQRRSAPTPETARGFAERFTDQVLAGIEEPRLKQLAIREIAQGLQQAAEAQDLPFPRRRLTRLPRPAAPLRRDGWQNQARFAFDCDDRLSDILDRRCRGLDARALAGVVLASAILRGLLLRPDAWPVFLNGLISGGLSLHKAPSLQNLVWIDLKLPLAGGQATNHSQKAEWFRFFPDVVTLALLRRWRGMKPAEIALVASPAEALHHMVSALFDDPPPTPPNSEAFAAAAMAPREDRSDQPLPYALTALASGTLSSFGASESSWLACHGAADRRQDNAKGRNLRNSKVAATAAAGQSATQAFASLSAALQTQSPFSVKQTRMPVEHALDGLPHSILTPAAHALRLWYIQLLQAGRKVSTVQRYHTALARVLLALCKVDDPAEMTPAELEDLLEGFLTAPTASPYDLARLAQFCAFATASPLLRWPEAVIAGESATSARHPQIRAELISARQIRDALRNWPGQDPNLREIEQVAFLLAVRGGLRLSDMAALCVEDILAGEEGGVMIHATTWSDIKSSATRRKVPIQLFARGDEAQLLTRFFAQRRNRANSPREQLLAQTGGLFGATQFDRAGFASRLRDVLDVTPHALRHAAISNLALLTMTGKASHRKITALTGWPAAQQDRMRQRLMGVRPDGRAALLHLARIAGHSRPETMLHHYVHVASLALGLVIEADCEALPPKRAARWLGLNRRNLPGAARSVVLETRRKTVLEGLDLRAMPQIAVEAEVISPQAPQSAPGVEQIARLLIALDRGERAAALAQNGPFSRADILALSELALSLGRTCAASGPVRHLPPEPRRHGDRQLSAVLITRLMQMQTEDRLAWSLQTLRAARRNDLSFPSRRAFDAWQVEVAPTLAGLGWEVATRGGHIVARPLSASGQPVAITSLTRPARLICCHAGFTLGPRLRNVILRGIGR